MFYQNCFQEVLGASKYAFNVWILNRFHIIFLYLRSNIHIQTSEITAETKNERIKNIQQQMKNKQYPTTAADSHFGKDGCG
jgi:hypothetical protein